MRRTPDDIVSSAVFKQTKHAYTEFSTQFRQLAENYSIQTAEPEYKIIPARKTPPWYQLRIHTTSGDELLAIDAQFTNELDAISLLQIYVSDETHEDAAQMLRQYTLNYFDAHTDLEIHDILS